MEYVSKSKLKPKLLEYLRHVEETQESLIITSHNKPVLKIEPIKPALQVSDVFGTYWGKIHIPDSIIEPETDEWGDV